MVEDHLEIQAQVELLLRVEHLFQVERDLPPTSAAVRELQKEWPTAEKQYRYISRASLESTEFPVRVDVSAVKSARGRGMTEAGLLKAPVTYEVEIEVLHGRVDDRIIQQAASPGGASLEEPTRQEQLLFDELRPPRH